MRTLQARLVALAATVALVVAPAMANPKSPDTLQGRVRHELLMLPYLSVFDDLSYRVDGSTVTLFGEVTRPIVKSDAGNAVKKIEGVTAVDNQIEVLPLSAMDDQIRLRAYRAMYRPLQRYFMGTQPSIRIVVKNGNVTLKGVVSSEFDKQVAFARTNGLPFVFSVTNQLRVEK